jgi:hypothetical protein
MEKRKAQKMNEQGFIANPISAFSKKFTLRKNKATKMFVKPSGNIERLHGSRERM